MTLCSSTLNQTLLSKREPCNIDMLPRCAAVGARLGARFMFDLTFGRLIYHHWDVDSPFGKTTKTPHGPRDKSCCSMAGTTWQVRVVGVCTNLRVRSLFSTVFQTCPNKNIITRRKWKLSLHSTKQSQSARITYRTFLTQAWLVLHNHSRHNKVQRLQCLGLHS